MKIKILIMLGIIILMSACAALDTTKPPTPTSEENNSKKEENFDITEEGLDLPYYGELKVVQKADLQKISGTGERQSINKSDILVVQDEVTGCMYFSNNKVYESLTPVYDETGKVKGCGESVEQ